MRVKETWIKPWKGELIVGRVVALSGSSVVCRTSGGFEFRVALDDVYAGKFDLFDAGQIMGNMHRRGTSASDAKVSEFEHRIRYLTS